MKDTPGTKPKAKRGVTRGVNREAKRKATVAKYAKPSNDVTTQGGVVPPLAGAIRTVRGILGQAKNPKGANKPVLSRKDSPPATSTRGKGPTTPRSSVKGPTPAQVKAMRQNTADDAGNLREYLNGDHYHPVSRAAEKAQATRDLGRGASGQATRSGAWNKAYASRVKNVVKKEQKQAAKKGEVDRNPSKNKSIAVSPGRGRIGTKVKPKTSVTKGKSTASRSNTSLSRGQQAAAARYRLAARRKK